MVCQEKNNNNNTVTYKGGDLRAWDQLQRSQDAAGASSPGKGLVSLRDADLLDGSPHLGEGLRKQDRTVLWLY